MPTKAEPNVVPLCDVLLVLLIIFMVITPIVQRGIDVNLPETTQESSSTPLGVIVMTLHNDMRVDVNQQYMAFNEAETFLRNQYADREDKTIFIKAESTVPFSRVIKLIDIAKGAGVETLAMIPEKFEETTTS
ncbi:MAG: ExbD/TolR family protein [Candidatus Aminicenantaceae bacterium]